MAIRNIPGINVQNVNAPIQSLTTNRSNFLQNQSSINDLPIDQAAINHLTSKLDNSFKLASIKPGELGWGVISPGRAALGFSAARVASQTADRIFAAIDPGRRHSPDDNEQNAFKHAYWNALMVKSFARYESAQRGGGKDLNTRLLSAAGWARRFADAHEQDIPFFPANTREQHDMDYRNNQVGRRIAMQILSRNPNATDQQLADAVMNALRRGQLTVIRPEYPRPF